MSHSHLVSFIEVGGDLCVVMGAGTRFKVPLRYRKSPYLRVMLRESLPRGGGVRARIGRWPPSLAELEYLERGDPMLLNGAALELVSFWPSLTFLIVKDFEALLDTFGDYWDVHWFCSSRSGPREIVAIDEDAAYSSLSRNAREPGMVVIQFGGMREEFEAMMRCFAASNVPFRG